MSRSELNGRMRDFYDVYLIYTRYWENININNFRKAIKTTFLKREYNGNPIVAIQLLKRSELLKNRWQIYQMKYDYAKNISFDNLLVCIDEIITEIEPIVV